MFHTFVDEAEIEDWFEEEKAKLNKVFYDASYNKKNVEKAKKIFDEKFSQLLKQYDREFENLTKRTERKKKIRKPLSAVKAWWALRLTNWRRARKLRKELRAKKKFDKEYTRLMKK